MDEPASVKSQIEYGLDEVADDRTVTVPLKDLLYVHQTIGELLRFFHQPEHYPSVERVQDFLGSVDSDGAYAALHRCYFEVLRGVWPEDIVAKFDDGDFDSAATPFYFQPDEEGGRYAAGN